MNEYTKRYTHTWSSLAFFEIKLNQKKRKCIDINNNQRSQLIDLAILQTKIQNQTHAHTETRRVGNNMLTCFLLILLWARLS